MALGACTARAKRGGAGRGGAGPGRGGSRRGGAPDGWSRRGLTLAGDGPPEDCYRTSHLTTKRTLYRVNYFKRYLLTLIFKQWQHISGVKRAMAMCFCEARIDAG